MNTNVALPKSYGYPVLMKAGLGNMLFPWADCYLWCKDHGAVMIAPFWAKLRIGPYLRREKDKRSYERLFKDQNHVSGFKRLIVLASVKQYDYEKFDEEYMKKDAIVRFTSMACMDRLMNRRDEVKRGLVDIIRPKYLPKPSIESFIGIHVRLGDYAVPDIKSTSWISRLPIEWYVAALDRVRDILGVNFKAIVFSDGLDSELLQLLRKPNVSRSPYNESITDIMALSQAKIIIGSCSTFSTFGVFLSDNASVIWRRGRRPANIFDNEKKDIYEAEWDIGEQLPQLFTARLMQLLE
jgi:hypothetical protein